MTPLPIVPLSPNQPPEGGHAELQRPLGESGGHPDLREEDLYQLLVDFYAQVTVDPLLATYFADIDMADHLPTIVDFWSTLVFHTGRYSGNAFRPHLLMPGLTGRHFGRWLETLERVIDAHFAGAASDRMKDFAHRVAHSMQLRLGIHPFVTA